MRWIDEASGSTEPEHPAPTLTLVKAATEEKATAPAANPAIDTDALPSGEFRTGSSDVLLGDLVIEEMPETAPAGIYATSRNN